MIGRKRVVVTGLGVLAANGIGKDAFWNSLLAGESGIGPITLFDASDLKCQIAGEVKNFDPKQYIPNILRPGRLARFSQLALAATKMAVDDAKLSDVKQISLCLGVSTSATDIIEPQVIRIHERGAHTASPLTAVLSLPQAGVSAIANMLGFDTQLTTLSTGCPAGLDAIGTASKQISEGRYDVAIAGGADAPITMLTMATFCAADMVPDTRMPPEEASRPFDLNRNGGILAEGACLVILENYERAVARNAHIYGEVLGYASAGEVAGSTSGSGLARCMSDAIANAGLHPDDIDIISAHGPSDKNMDLVETNMIKNVFGRHAYEIPVTSIKGVTGNPLSAAGPMQTISSLLAMQFGIIPPTHNCEIADPHCDLDYVSKKPRHTSVRTALINNHGLGGGNSTLIIRKV